MHSPAYQFIDLPDWQGFSDSWDRESVDYDFLKN